MDNIQIVKIQIVKIDEDIVDLKTKAQELNIRH